MECKNKSIICNLYLAASKPVEPLNFKPLRLNNIDFLSDAFEPWCRTCLEPFCGTLKTDCGTFNREPLNLFVRPLSESESWAGTWEPLSVESSCGTFEPLCMPLFVKALWGTFIWNLWAFEPLGRFCAEPLCVEPLSDTFIPTCMWNLRLETLCEIFIMENLCVKPLYHYQEPLSGSLEILSMEPLWNLGEPGARFWAAAPNHSETVVARSQAFYSLLGDTVNFRHLPKS